MELAACFGILMGFLGALLICNIKFAVDDFKEKLDDYLDDCKNNLAVVNKVYKSFADAMTPNSARETVLRIG
jgi:hypothetical protein